jgi:hypothetical protein
LCEPFVPVGQGGCEFHGFEGSDRHALAVNRIETGDRVAEHQVPFGKTSELFVATTNAGRKPHRLRFAHWIGVLDDLVNVRCRNGTRKRNETLEFGRRDLAEMPDQRNCPTLALLRQRHAAAFACRRWRDDSGNIAAKMFGSAAEKPGRVGKRHFDTLFLWSRIAERCEPVRAVRTAAGRIDDKIGSNFGAGPLNASNTTAVATDGQSDDTKIVKRLNVWQGQHALAHACLQKRASHQKALQAALEPRQAGAFIEPSGI